MIKKFFTLVSVLAIVLIQASSLFAVPNQVATEYKIDQIGFSTSSDAPDTATIKNVNNSPFIMRVASNSAYILNSAIGTNSLMYTGSMEPGTYSKAFLHGSQSRPVYDDGTFGTWTDINFWGTITISSPITITADENSRIVEDYSASGFNVTKTAL